MKVVAIIIGLCGSTLSFVGFIKMMKARYGAGGSFYTALVIFLSGMGIGFIAISLIHFEENNIRNQFLEELVDIQYDGIKLAGLTLDSNMTTMVYSELLQLKRGEPHHSHPIDTFELVIDGVTERKVLVCQDSDYPTEYWIFLPEYNDVEIGRINTNIFHQYFDSMMMMESWPRSNTTHQLDSLLLTYFHPRIAVNFSFSMDFNFNRITLESDLFELKIDLTDLRERYEFGADMVNFYIDRNIPIISDSTLRPSPISDYPSLTYYEIKDGEKHQKHYHILNTDMAYDERYVQFSNRISKFVERVIPADNAWMRQQRRLKAAENQE